MNGGSTTGQQLSRVSTRSTLEPDDALESLRIATENGARVSVQGLARRHGVSYFAAMDAVRILIDSGRARFDVEKLLELCTPGD